jgi:hypothetical protein
MTYIYDDFTWAHCTETDFPSLFEAMHDDVSTLSKPSYLNNPDPSK